MGSHVVMLDRKRITATSSSKFGDASSQQCSASLALDGINSHLSNPASELEIMACTGDNDPTPWIQLDLGSVYTIHEVCGNKMTYKNIFP